MGTNYQQEYTEFMSKYRSGVVGPESIGKTIAQFGQYFGEANRRFAEALKAYRKIAAQFEGSTDDTSGKAISSAKASKLAEATKESDNLLDAKTELENVDKQIMTLSLLQKSIISEFGHPSI